MVWSSFLYSCNRIGELLDSIYLYNKYGAPIGYDLWINVAKMVDWVCDNWTRKDEGIWEVRRYVYI